jgi:hypothetical protein
MVAAYLQQPLLQDDIARWLDSDDFLGTPASRISRMSRRGFYVTYNDFGTQTDLEECISQHIPPILFVLTGELSYWSINTQHAIVVAGFDGGNVHLFDSCFDTVPKTISIDELLLAWSHFDYTYATLTVQGA